MGDWVPREAAQLPLLQSSPSPRTKTIPWPPAKLRTASDSGCLWPEMGAARDWGSPSAQRGPEEEKRPKL